MVIRNYIATRVFVMIDVVLGTLFLVGLIIGFHILLAYAAAVTLIWCTVAVPLAWIGVLSVWQRTSLVHRKHVHEQNMGIQRDLIQLEYEREHYQGQFVRIDEAPQLKAPYSNEAPSEKFIPRSSRLNAVQSDVEQELNDEDERSNLNDEQPVERAKLNRASEKVEEEIAQVGGYKRQHPDATVSDIQHTFNLSRGTAHSRLEEARTRGYWSDR